MTYLTKNPNKKTKASVIIPVRVVLFMFLQVFFSYALAQDSARVVELTKKIIEAAGNDERFLALEDLTDLYFSENKYTQFIDLINSLSRQHKALRPTADYYCGLSRYYQLRHLEEDQLWDEYFSQGNAYREEVVSFLKRAMSVFSGQDALSVYSRLVLWKFHEDEQDQSREAALSDLYAAAKRYSQNAANLTPLKDVADELRAYGQKVPAKEIYKIYVDKLAGSQANPQELKGTADELFSDGNIELSQALYDVYIQRIWKTAPPEQMNAVLKDIALKFSFHKEGAKDAQFAEKIFAAMEQLGSPDAFDEELSYQRAFNLEKAREYLKAKDMYLAIAQRDPGGKHFDEALYKVGIITAYALKDIEAAKGHFSRLSAKDGQPSPEMISAMYQLGLLSQWQVNINEAKVYYAKVIETAKEGFRDTVALAGERLKEISESRDFEYNLRTFLDACLRDAYTNYPQHASSVNSRPYKVKDSEPVTLSSLTSKPESGCFELELGYLWSGHLGRAPEPAPAVSTFTTNFPWKGTKEINLVVVSPGGVVDYGVDMVNVYDTVSSQ